MIISFKQAAVTTVTLGRQASFRHPALAASHSCSDFNHGRQYTILQHNVCSCFLSVTRHSADAHPSRATKDVLQPLRASDQPPLALTLILRRSRTGTVWFYTSTSNKTAARPKLYTESLTRDLKLMYSRFTLVRISIKL